MIKYIFTIAIIILPVLHVFGQPGHGQRRRGDFQQVEAERVAFITRYLELTSEEAKKFWPVYNDFQERKNNLVQERQSVSTYFSMNYDNLSEEEAVNLADQYINLQAKESNLTTEFHDKFKEVLPLKKVMQLYQAENAFRMQLLRRLRRGQGRDPGLPGRD